MPKASKAPKAPRELIYVKCQRCRFDKAKCLPESRQWPGPRCSRCERFNYTCSKSRTKAQESALHHPSEESKSSDTATPFSERTDGDLITALGDLTWLRKYSFEHIFWDRDLNDEDLREEIRLRASGYLDKHLSSSTALLKCFGNRKKASLLLEMGANPNATDGMYRTVLHLAISCQNLNLVKEFLSLPDINVNAQDTRGDTPLHYQVSLGSFPTLLYDPRVDVNQLNRAGLSPLATSALWGDKTTFQDFVECPFFTLGTDPGTLSPLICAAQQDWKDLTLQLLTKVPDASTHRGLDGKGIVHWAVINEWDDVLQAAVTHAKAKVNATDYSGKTGLHYAAQLGLYKMVRQLLRHGASARSQDSFGRTPVHTAAVEGFADVLRPLLLESDFDPDDADQQKRCVVHWAASCDWDYLMKIVLELPDIDVKKRDHHGRTASHVAALCGCPNVLRVMIEYDVFDASDTDAFNNTSLHLAARGQSLTAVEILLPQFAMFKDRVNRWGQTARDVAVAYGSYEIEAILRHEGFRIKAPPVTRIGASYKPLYKLELPYHQTPDHLALVRYDLERAPESVRRV